MLVLDGHKSAVYALAFSPDGGRLASGDHQGTVLLWSGGEPLSIRTAEDAKQVYETFNALVFSQDGSRVIAAAANGLIDMPADRSAHAAKTPQELFQFLGECRLEGNALSRPRMSELQPRCVQEVARQCDRSQIL